MIAADCACDCHSNEDDGHVRILLKLSDSVEQRHKASESFLPLVKGLSQMEQK